MAHVMYPFKEERHKNIKSVLGPRFEESIIIAQPLNHHEAYSKDDIYLEGDEVEKIINVFIENFTKNNKRDDLKREGLMNRFTRLQGMLTLKADKSEIKIGDSISESIDRGLSQSSYVIALVGPNDKQSSWATKELEIALAKGKPIIPVMINDAKITDLPDKISDYLAIDASSDPNDLVKVYEAIDKDRGLWDRVREYIVND